MCLPDLYCSPQEAYVYREEDKDAKARRVVRANNFTQQTNALDVDKHMSVSNPIPSYQLLMLYY